jgi:hypothetical protein
MHYPLSIAVLVSVIGRFKTGHLWALQNRPGK